MLRLVSLMFIVPVMALAFCVSVHVIFSEPLVSDEVPAQVPDSLIGVVGVGEAGVDMLPPHAPTINRLRTANIGKRIPRSPFVMTLIVEVICPARDYIRPRKSTRGKAKGDIRHQAQRVESTVMITFPRACPASR
jgi:hypothetical protein